MAPSLVQSKSGSGTSVSSLTITLSSATTAGNCLVVAVTDAQTLAAPATISNIKIGGSADNFTAAETLTGSTSAPLTAAWIDPGCAGGQTSVVITLSKSITTVIAWVMEWSGVAPATPLDGSGNSGSGSSASFSSGSTGTLGASGDVVIGVTGAGVSSAPAITGPSGGWTNLSQVDDGSSRMGLIAGYQVVAGTTAQTYSGTLTSAAWASVIIALKAGTTTVSGTATLSGSGTLAAAGVFAASSALSGSGSLSSTGPLLFQGATLTGSGTLSGSVIGTIQETITLSGSGTLTGTQTGTAPGTAALSGTGSLGSAVIFRYPAALSGTGTLSIIGTGGTVAASPGASVPYAFPGTSQVSVAPQGSSNWQYLGSLGSVTALKYSFACPGGADQMTCTVMVPADYRTSLFNPGWQVRVTRGGHVVWTGTLDEPQPSPSGWNLTAVGTGNLGQNYVAIYSDTWPAGEPDEAVNQAIARGLPWVNPGIGSPSGIWLGQGVDSGAQTITALLNLACTRGALTWYVNSQPGGYPGADLSVFPLPTTVNRLLVCTQPVARTLGGDINSIWIKYEITAASSSTTSTQTATYGTVNVQNAASVAAHGVLETYIDLSSAGVMTSAAAEQIGQNVLDIYVRASFAGPFTVNYGQLLNAGGQPVDPGTDQAGTVCRAILLDEAYGGEVTPGPVEFLVGAYSYDDFSQTATLTPYQSLDMSITNMLSAQNTVLAPIQAQS